MTDDGRATDRVGKLSERKKDFGRDSFQDPRGGRGRGGGCPAALWVKFFVVVASAGDE